ARSRTRANIASRASAVICLLSLRPSHEAPVSSTTAAATTGPASGPRPASSTPATASQPPRSRVSARRILRHASGITSLLGGGRRDRLLLGQTSALAGLAAQIEQLRAAHLGVTHHLDVGHRRPVHRERALDADAFA